MKQDKNALTMQGIYEDLRAANARVNRARSRIKSALLRDGVEPCLLCPLFDEVCHRGHGERPQCIELVADWLSGREVL